MPFNLSLLKVLDQQPWRYTTQPTEANPAGVKQTLNGVFILLSDELVDYMRATMTQAEKDEIAPWVNRYTADQCATWNVPLWSGQDSAVYLRIPATVWANPNDPVPLKVKRYFRDLFREDTQ